MKKLLYRPELYGRLNMSVQAKFQSTYGLALYENCIRFQGIEQTPWFDVEKFRKLMGIEEGKYKIFRDFKHRVLDKAIEEVNKYSPLTVTPQYRKQGRQVISIQFMIKPTNNVAAGDSDTSLTNLAEILKIKFGLSGKQTGDVLKLYEEDYIREKINVVEASSSFQQGKITNLAKYLICALKDDYQLSKSNKKENKIANFQPEKIRKNKQDQTEAYRHYQHKEIMKLFNKQSKTKQKSLLAEFEKYLGKSIYVDIYQRDGLANILIQDQLCLFIKYNKVEFLNNIMPYTAFCDEKERDKLMQLIG